MNTRIGISSIIISYTGSEKDSMALQVVVRWHEVPLNEWVLSIIWWLLLIPKILLTLSSSPHKSTWFWNCFSSNLYILSEVKNKWLKERITHLTYLKTFLPIVLRFPFCSVFSQCTHVWDGNNRCTCLTMYLLKAVIDANLI